MSSLEMHLTSNFTLEENVISLNFKNVSAQFFFQPLNVSMQRKYKMLQNIFKIKRGLGSNLCSSTHQSLAQSSKAVQFVYIDDEGHFQIAKEAIKMFEASTNKVAIICVTGCYRTGKSYLMNQLVGDPAFLVDPSVNACTRGLWLYSEPITIEKDGEIFDIYLMDSEGLGGVDKNQNYDVKIFTLALLLSSFLLYNQVGVIDEAAIQNLSYLLKTMTNLAKNIQVQKNQQSNSAGDSISQYFPSFLWLLRDFMLELADEDGNPITPGEYLELCLKEAEGFSQKIQEKNRIRSLIKQFFKNRYCFTMIRPTDDERDIQNLSKPSAKVKPEFIDQIEELKIFIFNRIKPLKLNGQAIKSQDYLVLANSYLQQINKGGIPTITDAWTEVVENQLKIAVAKAGRNYQKSIKQFLQQYAPVDMETLSKQHKLIKTESIDILEKAIASQSGVSETSKEKSRTLLVQSIKDAYEAVKNKVKIEYERQSKDILAELYRERILPKQYADLVSFYKDWQDLEKSYFQKVQGKQKYEMWSKFALEKIIDGSNRISKTIESKKDLQYKQMELEIGRLNTVIEMNKEQSAALIKAAVNSKPSAVVQAEKINSVNDQMVMELSRKLVAAQQKENELRMNIVAYKELVERKDEQIQSLEEQLGRMRATSIYGTPGQHRDNNSQYRTSNQPIQPGIEGVEMIPMCGTKNDCKIF